MKAAQTASTTRVMQALNTDTAAAQAQLGQTPVVAPADVEAKGLGDECEGENGTGCTAKENSASGSESPRSHVDASGDSITRVDLFGVSCSGASEPRQYPSMPSFALHSGGSGCDGQRDDGQCEGNGCDGQRDDGQCE